MASNLVTGCAQLSWLAAQATPQSMARAQAPRSRSRYRELPGDDHLWFAGDADGILGEIEEFLTGADPVPEPARVLATVRGVSTRHLALA